MLAIVGGKGPPSTATKSCNTFVRCTRVLDASTDRGYRGELEDNIKIFRHFEEFWFPADSNKIKSSYIYFGNTVIL